VSSLANRALVLKLYSTNLSARTRMLSGIASPSVLAVLLLTTNWNFVGCSNRQIGRTGTFQYFVNLGCRPPIQVQVVRPVRH
jgi:hypothetical protein